MKRGHNGAIFDMDGVLVDSRDAHRESWFVLARETGVETTDELFERTFGMQNRTIMPLFFGRELTRAEIQRHSDRKEAVFRELIKGKLERLPGALELARALRKAGWALAIGSSGPRENVRFLLEEMGAGDLFRVVVAHEDVSRGKPEPDVFLEAARKLHVDPSRCVVFEDAVAGVEAGRAAGMKVVAITSTVAAGELGAADVIVDSFLDVDVERITALVEDGNG